VGTLSTVQTLELGETQFKFVIELFELPNQMKVEAMLRSIECCLAAGFWKLALLRLRAELGADGAEVAR